jgi:RNA polymerase sigma factor (sigma-70 family)
MTIAAPHSWPPTRPSLLQRIRDPDAHESWATFVAIYVPLIYRYCRRRGLQDADALDVTQQVLVEVRRFEYQQERGHFRGWLATVTRNKIARLRRTMNRPGRPTGAADSRPDLDAGASRGEGWDWTELFNARVLETAMERIRPEFHGPRWRAFLAVAFEEVEAGDGRRWAWVEKPTPGRARQVAREMGRPVGWVYKVKCEIFKRLKEEVLNIAEDIAPFG